MVATAWGSDVLVSAQSRLKREKVDGDYDNHCLLWAADTAGYQNLAKDFNVFSTGALLS